jgi:hypothetical protein
MYTFFNYFFIPFIKLVSTKLNLKKRKFKKNKKIKIDGSMNKTSLKGQLVDVVMKADKYEAVVTQYLVLALLSLNAATQSKAKDIVHKTIKQCLFWKKGPI